MRWLLTEPAEEGNGPEWLVLAISQRRAISHGFLLFLTIVAALYIALSARSSVSGSDSVLPPIATYSSESYLLRPPTAVPTVEVLLLSLQPYVEPGALDQQFAIDLHAAGVDHVHVADLAPTDELLLAENVLVEEEAESAPPAEETGPVEYQVRPGETLSQIAERFGISTETILWTNDLKSADLVRMGQTLVILPVDGVMYTVEKGDTLLSIASWFGVDTEQILGYPGNNISNPDSLKPGQQMIIPGGRVPASRAASTSTRGGTRAAEPAPVAPARAAPAPAAPAPAPVKAATASGSFVWPNRGVITQYFGGSHAGLDIASPMGTPIVAADSGVVVDAQRLTWGLGWYVTIDHGNGYKTTYAHMSAFAVGYGERVTKGQMIGRVGSTGLSTGPHNHFVVYRNGVPVNPLGVLP